MRSFFSLNSSIDFCERYNDGAIHQSPDRTGQPVPNVEEIASLSYSYVFKVMTPTGTFQLGELSSIVKHLYLVKEVRLIRQALKTLARKTLPEHSEDNYV